MEENGLPPTPIEPAQTIKKRLSDEDHDPAPIVENATDALGVDCPVFLVQPTRIDDDRLHYILVSHTIATMLSHFRITHYSNIPHQERCGKIEARRNSEMNWRYRLICKNKSGTTSIVPD